MKQNNKNRSNGRHARLNNRRSNNGITRNTVFDSCGPAGRIRAIAAQLIEKYTTLAKDAKADDDRVLYETYMQYAEHYIRMLEIATANDTFRQPHDYAPESAVEDVTDDTATLQETSAVQKEQGEANECGMLVLDSDVPGAEAAATTNACDATNDATEQNAKPNKRPFQKRKPHHIKIEKQPVATETVVSEPELE